MVPSTQMGWFILAVTPALGDLELKRKAEREGRERKRDRDTHIDR